jgi:hypothetical protein
MTKHRRQKGRAAILLEDPTLQETELPPELLHLSTEIPVPQRQQCRPSSMPAKL